jgi:hypothetical protein
VLRITARLPVVRVRIRITRPRIRLRLSGLAFALSPHNATENTLGQYVGMVCVFFLKIPADETNKHFNCPETTQQKLINLTFWVCDYIEGVKTKFGENRTLVKIKMNRDDHDRDARKFFTNSREIKYVLAKIREMDKFPRRVTMRASGTRYYLE